MYTYSTFLFYHSILEKHLSINIKKYKIIKKPKCFIKFNAFSTFILCLHNILLPILSTDEDILYVPNDYS